MYEVWIYDEDGGNFIPVRVKGKVLRFKISIDAENAMWTLKQINPNDQYRVEYGRMRGKKR